MIVKILDDFSLSKIANSGQCFRVKQFENSLYRFITGDNILYIKDMGHSQYEVSCSENDWNNIWYSYFHLSENYDNIRSRILSQDTFLLSAAEYGKGIRILRQDPWETLITFMISQRKSIPAIKECVELLSMKFGKPITTQFETVFAFPSVSELVSASEVDLLSCKLGYRAKYILDAIQKVSNKEVDFPALNSLNDTTLLAILQSIKGVGVKVANCVALFAYGRTSLAPIDTWIQKIISQVYFDRNPFSDYPETAGIMQQYLFYYVLANKEVL